MIDRVVQMAWVLEHLDDIASDLSAFHRVDDITALDGPVFLKLAWRLATYSGVMQARAVAEQERDEQSPSGGGRASTGRGDVNPGTQTTLKSEAAFAGIFSFGG